MCLQLIVKVHLHRIPKESGFLFNSEKKKSVYQNVAGCILLGFYSVETDRLKKSFYDWFHNKSLVPGFCNRM